MFMPHDTYQAPSCQANTMSTELDVLKTSTTTLSKATTFSALAEAQQRQLSTKASPQPSARKGMLYFIGITIV